MTQPATGGPVNMTDDEMQALYERAEDAMSNDYEPGANTVEELPDSVRRRYNLSGEPPECPCPDPWCPTRGRHET